MLEFFAVCFVIACIGGTGYLLWLKGAAMLVMLATFFAAGSLPFWVVFAIALIATWILVDGYDDGATALIPFIAFCVFAQFIAKVDVAGWMLANAGYVSRQAFWYLALGFCYALGRWILHVSRKARELDDHLAEFRKKRSFVGELDSAEAEIRYAFQEYVSKLNYNPNIVTRNAYHDVCKGGVVPTFSSNKYTVLRWFWWWPISFAGWMLSDFIREALSAVKRSLQWFADGVTKAIFGRRGQFVLSETETADYLAQRNARMREESDAADRSMRGRGPTRG